MMRRALLHPSSLVVWAYATLVYLTVQFLIATRTFIWQLGSPALALERKAAFAWETLTALVSSNPASALVTLASGLVFGLNLVLLMLAWRVRRLSAGGGMLSAAGITGALLSFGCAACGSFALPAISLFLGLATLPLRGLEISLLALMLFVLSSLLTYRTLQRRRCPVHTPSDIP